MSHLVAQSRHRIVKWVIELLSRFPIVSTPVRISTWFTLSFILFLKLHGTRVQLYSAHSHEIEKLWIQQQWQQQISKQHSHTLHIQIGWAFICLCEIEHTKCKTIRSKSKKKRRNNKQNTHTIMYTAKTSTHSTLKIIMAIMMET